MLLARRGLDAGVRLITCPVEQVRMIGDNRVGISFELPVSLMQGILTGGPAFCALLLGYSYFVMGWATTRMHDWESIDSEQRKGSPALVVWTSGVATLMAAVLGVSVFLVLYAGLVPEMRWFRWLCLI